MESDLEDFGVSEKMFPQYEIGKVATEETDNFGGTRDVTL